MVQISLQNFGGKVVFLGGVPPPWVPTGVKVPWSLKGTNDRQKTYEISHVYSIFYSGFMCQTT